MWLIFSASCINRCEDVRSENMRPPFDQLPTDHTSQRPYKSAWDLYGPDDELGTLNELNAETVRHAVSEVQYGNVIPLKSVTSVFVYAIGTHLLSLALNVPVVPMNPARNPMRHTIIAKGHANDDEVGPLKKVAANLTASSCISTRRALVSQKIPYERASVDRSRQHTGTVSATTLINRPSSKFPFSALARRLNPSGFITVRGKLTSMVIRLVLGSVFKVINLYLRPMCSLISIGQGSVSGGSSPEESCWTFDLGPRRRTSTTTLSRPMASLSSSSKLWLPSRMFTSSPETSSSFAQGGPNIIARSRRRINRRSEGKASARTWVWSSRKRCFVFIGRIALPLLRAIQMHMKHGLPSHRMGVCWCPAVTRCS